MKWLCTLLLAIGPLTSSWASFLDTTFDVGTGANGLVEQVLELPDGKVLICGNFTSFNKENRAYIARLNSDGSVDLSFDAHPSYWVRHMAVQPDGKVVIGGYFTTVDDVPRNLIARLNSNGSLDATFDPGTGAEDIIAGGIDGNITPFVFWMDIQQDGKILITGNFRKYNGDSSTGFARINPDGSRDNEFKMGSGLDSWGRVIKIARNGQIYLGGWFTSYNGFNANRLVRIDPDGTVDSSFNAYYGDLTSVYSIAELPDGKLITSGHSKNLDGLFKENVRRLNADGSVDKTWLGRANEKTESVLVVRSNQLVLGGYFSELSGERRAGIGRLNEDGSVDKAFFAQVDNFIWTVAPARNDKILISGGFTTIDGIPRTGVARLILPESTGPISTPPPTPPEITDVRVADSKFRLSFATSPGRTYTLEASEDPGGPWTTLSATRAFETSLDLEDPTPGTKRFYRLHVR